MDKSRQNLRFVLLVKYVLPYSCFTGGWREGGNGVCKAAGPEIVVEGQISKFTPPPCLA